MPVHTGTPPAPRALVYVRRYFCGLVVLVAVLTGCQSEPRVIVSNLPTYSIIRPSPRPAPKPVNRTVRVTKPVVRTTKPPATRTPREWTPRVNERPWRWIVLHHSATDTGSAASFDRAHRARGWDELGYHFVITNGRGGRDGHVDVGSRWTKQKWGAHCGGTPNNAYNNYGIGICLVGNSSKKLPSPKQLASLRKLLRFLTARYGISPGRIIGHRDAPNTATCCPGEVLHRYINDVIRPEISRHCRLNGK